MFEYLFKKYVDLTFKIAYNRLTNRGDLVRSICYVEVLFAREEADGVKWYKHSGILNKK